MEKQMTIDKNFLKIVEEFTKTANDVAGESGNNASINEIKKLSIEIINYANTSDWQHPIILCTEVVDKAKRLSQIINKDSTDKVTIQLENLSKTAISIIQNKIS